MYEVVNKANSKTAQIKSIMISINVDDILLSKFDGIEFFWYQIETECSNIFQIKFINFLFILIR